MLNRHDRRRELVRKEKKRAREELGKFKPFDLSRGVFFVHGWGDEANICWTESYTEVGKNKDPRWDYTIKDWLSEKVTNHEKLHFLKLVEDEKKIRIYKGRRQHTKIDIYGDRSYYYICFYQFAELLKKKIAEVSPKGSYDLVCHSMGGLDAVAAIALDKKDDETGFITSPCLEGVRKLITVATPHQGSPKANWADSTLAKWVFNNTIYVRALGINMSHEKEFIKQINNLGVIRNLMNRIEELHLFGAGNDRVVPRGYWKINTSGVSTEKITEYRPITYAEHSQKEGVTQDPRLILKVMKILSRQGTNF